MTRHAVCLPPRVGRAIKASLLFPALDGAAILGHLQTVEDSQAARDALRGAGLVGFVANGSILPRKRCVRRSVCCAWPVHAMAAVPAAARNARRVCMSRAHPPCVAHVSLPWHTNTTHSGASDLPMMSHPGLVPFKSPPSLEVTLTLPHKGPVSGMGVRAGITLIAGGGFHGKSTLLQVCARRVAGSQHTSRGCHGLGCVAGGVRNPSVQHLPHTHSSAQTCKPCVPPPHAPRHRRWRRVCTTRCPVTGASWS
jgi:hypothetical protein